MKIIVFVFILMTVSATEEQAGFGVVVVDIETTREIKFLKAQGDKQPELSITLIDRKGEVAVDGESHKGWFKPHDFWLDYSIFNFRCIQLQGDWAEVVVNQETGLSKWILLNEHLIAVSWEKFLVEHTTAIDPVKPTSIKSAPGAKSQTIRQSTAQDCFEALEIRGEWLKIRTNETLECNEHPNPVESGWIKWKEGERMLIKYFLTC